MKNQEKELIPAAVGGLHLRSWAEGRDTVDLLPSNSLKGRSEGLDSVAFLPSDYLKR